MLSDPRPIASVSTCIAESSALMIIGLRPKSSRSESKDAVRGRGVAIGSSRPIVAADPAVVLNKLVDGPSRRKRRRRVDPRVFR